MCHGEVSSLLSKKTHHVSSDVISTSLHYLTIVSVNIVSGLEAFMSINYSHSLVRIAENYLPNLPTKYNVYAWADSSKVK